jgi:hypothetical protein
MMARWYSAVRWCYLLVLATGGGGGDPSIRLQDLTAGKE